MASTKELGRGYAARLRVAFDKSGEVQDIADEINSLTYTTTGGAISKTDKLRIVQEIEDEFSISTKDSRYGVILREADNKKYLDLVKNLKDLLA